MTSEKSPNPDKSSLDKKEGSLSPGASAEESPAGEQTPEELAEDIGEIAVEESVSVPNTKTASEETWAESVEFEEPRDAVWHGPIEDLHIKVTGVMRASDGREFVRVKDGPMPLLASDVEYVAHEVTPGTAEHTQSEPKATIEKTESSDGSEETIKEDAEEAGAELPEPKDLVGDYLREVIADKAKIDQISKILASSVGELVHLHLSGLGVEEEKIETVAHLLVPLNLYLKRLQELGMPVDKNEEAHGFLVNEVGRIRIRHLRELVGGQEEVLRTLMKSHQLDLLASELKKMGFDDEKIREISATPRRDKSKLIQEALRKIGIENEGIEGIELAVALAEIPSDIAKRATDLGIPLETLVRAREAFKRADWKDTYDYLELAQKDERVREQLRLHGIEIEPTPFAETEDEKISRLRNMTLKEINEAHPEEWETERVRRVARKREELDRMLDKFRTYLPLDELPLPDDVEVPPEEKIPDDLIGAYGLWRRLLVDSYIKRIGNESTYASVRSEMHRVGGRLPLLRKIGQRWLAIRVLRSQKREAREKDIRGNFGAFGIGYSKYKQNFRAIENQDIKVQDVMRALDTLHKHSFVADGQETPRKRLAELVVVVKLREIALREGKLNPWTPHTGDYPGEKELTHEELVV